jgi:hypothetical protein
MTRWGTPLFLRKKPSERTYGAEKEQRADSLQPTVRKGGELLRGRGGVEDYEEERGDRTQEQGKGKPEKAAAILCLCEAGIDQAQGSPAGVIARLGERVKHAQIVAQFCGLVSRRSPRRVKTLAVES